VFLLQAFYKIRPKLLLLEIHDNLLFRWIGGL
jgi:hypothetical protein